MIKCYSDVLKDWFDSYEEADKAEKEKAEADAKQKAEQETILAKIKKVEEQRDKETADIDAQIDEKRSMIEALNEEIKQLKSDRANIRYEAANQISDLAGTYEKPVTDKFSFKYKSLNSEDPSKNIDFETTDYAEALKKLKSLSGTSLSGLLDKFGI